MISVSEAEISRRVEDFVHDSENTFRTQMKIQLNQVFANREATIIEKVKKSLSDDSTNLLNKMKNNVQMMRHICRRRWK